MRARKIGRILPVACRLPSLGQNVTSSGCRAMVFRLTSWSRCSAMFSPFGLAIVLTRLPPHHYHPQSIGQNWLGRTTRTARTRPHVISTQAGLPSVGFSPSVGFHWHWRKPMAGSLGHVRSCLIRLVRQVCAGSTMEGEMRSRVVEKMARRLEHFHLLGFGTKLIERNTATKMWRQRRTG